MDYKATTDTGLSAVIPAIHSITLPDGEILELAGEEMPCEGWGTEPGKWYSFARLNQNGSMIWYRDWIIPPASR